MPNISVPDPREAGPTAAPAKEACQTLDVLKNTGLVIEAEDSTPEQLAGQGFQPLPREVFAHVSGMLQPVSGLLASQAAQSAYANTFAGAYRLLIPKELSGLSRAEVKKLIDQFCPGAESMIFRGPNGRIAGHGGVQKIETPSLQPLNIMHIAFSAASVVTNQYFLCRIDQKLEAIQGQISEILKHLERGKRNKLRANLETLQSYYPRLTALSGGSPIQLLSAITEIQDIKRETLAFLYDYQEESQLVQPVKKKDREEAYQRERKTLQLYYYALYTYELAVIEELLLTQSTDSASLQEARRRLLELTATFRQIYMQKAFSPRLGLCTSERYVIDVSSNSIRMQRSWPDNLDRAVQGLDQLDRQLNSPMELVVTGEQIYTRYLEDPAPQEGQNRR